ncbi:hypothetical protein T484DRAFT_1751898 [Baffinella frigidus]|nr:hypothetical protein T484DRAFT_1751898 [Cryptophyta sp. CCMP2293]
MNVDDEIQAVPNRPDAGEPSSSRMLSKALTPVALLSTLLLLAASGVLLLQPSADLPTGLGGGREQLRAILDRGRVVPAERDVVEEKSWAFDGGTYTRWSMLVEQANTSQQRLPVLLAMPNVKPHPRAGDALS